jgi:tetratricopeptide (TPR) repeat protein
MAKSEEPKYKQRTYDNELIDYLPTHKLSLAVDSATVVANKVVPEMYDSLILKNMEFNFENKKAIHKVDAMMLEIVSANNWKRPIYYASTVPQDIYSYFGDYLLQTGLAMQVVPVNTKEHVLYTNTERMYDNVMNKFKWSGLDKPGLYLDETNMRMCKGQRSTYNLLANVLMQENKIDSALKVLDRCIESFPDYNVPYDRSVFPILISYLRLNQLEKAKPIGESLLNKLFTSIDWMLRLKPSFRRTVEGELQKDLHLAFDILNEFYQLDKEYAESFMPRFNSYSSQAQKTTNPQ